jgi:GNAT superfamily N-acetyltransferase
MTATTGLRIRAYDGEADIPEIVRVVNASSASEGVEEVWTVEGLTAWLAHPSDQFDPARDAFVAELEGRVVGTGRIEWVDTRDGRYREYRVFGTVDPALHGRGIGTALLATLEDRARALAATHPSERERLLAAFAAEGRPAEALLRAAGY